MQYIYENPQIQNQPLAEVMAYAYNPFHEVKSVAEVQGLSSLAETIVQEGERASEEAGGKYIRTLDSQSTSDLELTADLARTSQKYRPVLEAAAALGNTSVIAATERAQSEEENAVISGHRIKLREMLEGNTSELVLADDEGNFIEEPETITEDEMVRFALAHGHSRGMADKAWYSLQHSSAIQKMLLKPDNPKDTPRYDPERLVVDSILDVVERREDACGETDIRDIKNALRLATPGSIRLLKDFAAEVIAAREVQDQDA